MGVGVLASQELASLQRQQVVAGEECFETHFEG